jgi:arylsulfatase A-like enzyme
MVMACQSPTGLKVSHTPPEIVGCETLTENLSTGLPFDRSNILIILTDDIGMDHTAAWNAQPEPSYTPTLDALTCAGMSFRRAYSHPTCSPSRATLLTGRMPSRYGIGRWLGDSGSWGLPQAEVTLPELLAARGYSAGLAGKWHLGPAADPDAPRHMLDQGFEYHRGSYSNLMMALGTGHLPRGYWQWERLEDGVPAWTTDYNITTTTDDALRLVDLLPEPWFLYVAYNSAHDPLHRPPDHLLIDPEAVTEQSEDLDLYRAMVTATDIELGRLLTSIDADTLENTLVIYMADNGTPKWGITAPLDPSRGKGTAYEGGVHVPMIWAGRGVSESRSTSSALVSFADVFPTIAALVDLDLTTWLAPDATEPLRLDGESLKPLLDDPSQDTARTVLLSEAFFPAGAGPYTWTRTTAVSDTWKYVLLEGEDSTGDPDVDVREELYRIPPDDPEAGSWFLDEGPDLYAEGPLDADAQEAFDQLSQVMEDTLSSRPFEY